MKRTTIGAWAGVLAVVVLIVVIAHKQQTAAANYERDRRVWCDSNAPTPAQKASCPDEGPQRETYLPWWYVLGAWPEGIAAWGLLLTLGAIAWQSWETRKAAEASVRQFGIQRESLRPRLSISDFVNNVFNEAIAGGWVDIQMKIENSGGLPAYGVIVDTWMEFIHGAPPYEFSSDARYRKAAPINVHTGEPQGFSIPFHRKLTPSEIAEMRGAEGAICFRVKMNYLAFTEEVHTDQAYIVRPDFMDSIAEYTDAT